MEKKIAVILAGGVGTRFWPESLETNPKQFISFKKNGLSLLQETNKRVMEHLRPDAVFISTARAFLPIVCAQVPEIPINHILLEPCRRNTAASVAFAASVIGKEYGSESVILFFPSDHIIERGEAFRETMERAVSVAESGRLTVIGVPPSYAETGYGYIRKGGAGDTPFSFPVDAFVEKPDKETAQRYLASGTYFWNAGMIIAKAVTLVQELNTYMPSLREPMERISSDWGTMRQEDTIASIYPSCPKESFDYGVLEKSGKVSIVEATFDWDDVGTWQALERHNHQDADGNTVVGDDVFLLDTTHSIIKNNAKGTIGVIGLDDVAVVRTENALLICRKEKLQDTKLLVGLIKEKDNWGKSSFPGLKENPEASASGSSCLT